ncbi:25535_t:CDS:2 [Dentiscutata erythropus]|uniref:Inositol-pentakisphosphate 2-kinase n=1 Tax=Dentiscutata erythropus TaxID=1348616 RepID=A0A9N9JFF0_9GLOM|nr:25535_t:CDS:2 [Dentiscutata erythropus]
MPLIEAIPELYQANLWKYKTEGSSNVILAFIGKKERFFGTVLRLRKAIITNQDTSIDNVHSFVNQDLIDFYASSVIGPLLGEEYIGKSILLKVPQPFLKELSKAILPMRPENRIHKDIDFNQPYDLFSLDEVRLKRAIEELLLNPNNNLKLFIQGMQIHIGQNDWPTQLYEFFNFDQSSSDLKIQHKNVDVKNLLVILLSHTILEEQNLFKRLKQLQKTLDELDIEGIYKLFLEQQSGLHDPTIEEWQLIAKEYEKRIKSPGVPHLSMDGAQMRQRIYEFLMSTTLKDCSIIFTFQKSYFNDETKVVDGTGLFFKEKVKFIPFSNDDKIYFKYKVNVIDLDPKPVAKIPYYYELDAMIVNNYMKRDGITKKKCIE